MSKFDFVKVSTGNINAWDNDHLRSAIPEIQNKLQGKAITKKNIGDSMIGISIFSYQPEKYNKIATANVDQFFPTKGRAVVSYTNVTGDKGHLQLDWDPIIEPEKPKTSLESRVSKLEELVASLMSNKPSTTGTSNPIAEAISDRFGSLKDEYVKAAKAKGVSEEEADDNFFFEQGPKICFEVLSDVYKALLDWYPIDALMTAKQRELFEEK